MHFFRIFLYPSDISLELLRESTWYFGYNPRLCFRAAHSKAALVMKRENVMLQIRNVARRESNISQLLNSFRRGDSDVSHSVFAMFPRNEERLLTQCKFRDVSRWALDELLKQYKTRRADAAADFYEQISGVSEAAALWDPVFERMVLNYLDGVSPKHKFSIRGLTSSGKMTWSIPNRIRRFTFRRDSDFIDAITDAVRVKKPRHFVPFSRNFIAVDSIIYDPNSVLTFIQVTVARKHEINVLGLERIQNWLQKSTPLGALRPSGNRPWRFIFIVPSSNQRSFKLQRLGGDNQGKWAQKVHQYVLGLYV